MHVTSSDVIVIGGGFAGLVAARELAHAGRTPILVEARDRLGGRTWYRPFGESGRKVEFGGTWISPRTMRRAAAEIDRYGLRLTSRAAPGVDFRWAVGGRAGTAFPLAGDELYELERAWYGMIAAAHRLDPDTGLDTQQLADLDRPLGSFLDEMAPSRATRSFLETWARLGSGAPSSEWSLLQLLAWVAALDYSVLGYYAEVSQYLELGTESLVDAIVADGGFEIRTSTAIEAIRVDRDEVVLTTSDGPELRAGAVVVATPANLWGSMAFDPPLSEARAALARDGHPGRMRKVWIQAQGAPPNLVALGDTSAFLWLSCEYEVSDTQLLVGFVSPPSTLDPNDRDAVVAAVHELASGLEVLAVESHDWLDDPWSRGSWMVPRPGWLGRWSEVQAPAGRVSFAGADIATRWVGWIDGAIESGALAAGQALAVS